MKEQSHDRSYIVSTASGEYRRNRSDLNKLSPEPTPTAIPQTPTTPKPTMPEPTNAPSPVQSGDNKPSVIMTRSAGLVNQIHDTYRTELWLIHYIRD